MNFRLRHWAVSLVLALQLLPGIAESQEYPLRPVRMIVPYPAGGGVDLMARVMAERLSKIWGQPVLVENKAGGGTIIGAEFVAKAAPDGYTLLLTTDATITSNPLLHSRLPYDSLKDFAPITQLIGAPQIVVAHPSVTANTMDELVALARNKPGMLNYGSYGNGSQPHLLFESFKTQSGAQIASIPYRGAAPGLQAVVVGEVHLALVPIALSRGFIQTGKLKPIAIARTQRDPSLPLVPTLREAGFPDIDPITWFGLFATGGTPQPVIARIHTSVATIFADREFQERQVLQKGYDSAIGSPEEFAAFIRQDLEHKAKLIKGARIRAE